MIMVMVILCPLIRMQCEFHFLSLVMLRNNPVLDDIFVNTKLAVIEPTYLITVRSSSIFRVLSFQPQTTYYNGFIQPILDSRIVSPNIHSSNSVAICIQHNRFDLHQPAVDPAKLPESQDGELVLEKKPMCHLAISSLAAGLVRSSISSYFLPDPKIYPLQ
jgi:hypothetical protein